MDDFNSNMRFQRLMFIIAVVVITLFAGYTAFRHFDVAKRSEEMSQWFEENNEAVLFGCYLRLHDNDRWRQWHDKWVSDPGLKEDMSDYYLLEELKKDKEKK